jgi:hypothetical protein
MIYLLFSADNETFAGFCSPYMPFVAGMEGWGKGLAFDAGRRVEE